MTLEKHIDAIKKLGYDVTVAVAKDKLKEVHAGYHPVTGKAFMCADVDLPEQMTWVKAEAYIKENHPGWRHPTMAELQAMWHNRERIGGFNTTRSSGVANWYWSCTEHRVGASGVYFVDFTDGHADWAPKDGHSLSSRLVRAELPA